MGWVPSLDAVGVGVGVGLSPMSQPRSGESAGSDGTARSDARSEPRWHFGTASAAVAPHPAVPLAGQDFRTVSHSCDHHLGLGGRPALAWKTWCACHHPSDSDVPDGFGRPAPLGGTPPPWEAWKYRRVDRFLAFVSSQ